MNKLGLKKQGVISLIGGGGKTSLMFFIAKNLAESNKKVLTTTTTKIFLPEKEQSPHTIIADSFSDLLEKSKNSLQRFTHFSAGKKNAFSTTKLNGFEPDTIDLLWQANLFDWIIVEADGAKQKPIKATDCHEPVLPKETSHLILVTGLESLGRPLDDEHVHRAKIFSNNTEIPMGSIVNEQAIACSIKIEIQKGQNLCHPQSTFVFLNKADTPELISKGHRIEKLLQSKTNIDKIITASLKENK